jgi:ribonuclease E
MPNKMLIDASHPEETRVVVVHGNRIEEFDFESQDKKQLKGNIYLARVTRVEPSLQAAFVEYGGNRHGFLAFSEIHPDYYQIPVADRQALLKAEAEAAADEAEDEENEERGRGRRRRRGRGRGRPGEENGSEAAAEGATADDEASEPDAREASDESEAGVERSDAGDGEVHAESAASASDDSVPSMAASVEADVISESYSETSEGNGSDEAAAEAAEAHGGSEDASVEDAEIESVGAGDALDEAQSRRRPIRRQYKIQEVIKRRQILLVQVVKEERGNKGAALTTYLSLAGRYSVLMPNTARGGGISRKITNVQDRKRLKEVVQDLEVPQGMGVILRTAGESRTKAEIKRDYEYLMRLWENVRTLTLQSTAPALVYEEGSLIKRSVRDLYNKDIDEILVAGEEGYREAKDFMRMLMPSHAKVVQPYRESAPIFVRKGVEAQLDKMLQPQVTLKSGGYIIINQTEALVAIDVNSGRSTREHSIEETALHTNLEAAEEVARQLRLRDLAGLIVIDFIDMEESRNNRLVEKRLKDHLKNDRARIQLGRISHFGLMEMSRQRIRASVLESTTKPCPHCGGTGHVRSDSSVALFVVRAIEEYLLKDNRSHISVRTPNTTAMYVLNHKRASLAEMEVRFGVTITVEADETVGSQHYVIVRGAMVEKPIVPAPHAAIIPPEPEDEPEVIEESEAEEDVVETTATEARAPDGERGGRKRRRRRRRGGRDRAAPADAASQGSTEALSAEDDDDASMAEPEDEGAEAAAAETAAAGDDRKKRRRGRRGGKRHRDEAGAEEMAADSDENATSEAPKDAEAAADLAAAPTESPVDEPIAVVAESVDVVETVEPAVPKKGRRTSSRKKAADADDATGTEGTPRKKPAGRTSRKAADEPAAEQPGEIVAAPRVEAEATPEEPVAPAEVAEVEVSEVDALEVEIEASEADVASGSAEDGAPETQTTPPPQADKPKKSGWWQRRGFL